MTSLFGAAGGLPERPPAIFGSATAGQPSISSEWQQKITMMPMTLVPTTEPVWPDDEALEERASRDSGLDFPPLASDEEAKRIASEVRVELPDRLLGCVLKLPSNPWLATDSYEYYGLYVPTTFAAQPNIVPRRLRLQLTFGDATDENPQRPPIACQLYPGTKVATEITNIGDFKIDLGQAFQKTMWILWPNMPQVLTAKMGGSLDLKKIRARVQAAGVSSHKCEWYIADTEIAYVFNPACIVQVPKGGQLTVSARLYIEARKKIALVFYRTYCRTSMPRRYILGREIGQPVNSDDLADGSEVTLIQPGARDADEKTMYSFVKSELPKESEASSHADKAPPAARNTIARGGDQGTDLPPDAVDENTQQLAPLVDELSLMESMLDRGLLTREEFDQLKKRLIAGS